MKNLTFSYRGYEIFFSDNDETWSIRDFGDGGKSYDKPSKARAAIDKLLLDIRKKSSVEAYEIVDTSWTKAQLRPALITEYLGGRSERKSYTSSEFVYRHKVAVSALRGGNSKISRTETMIENLAKVCDESVAIMAEIVRANEEIDALTKKRNELLSKIPRMTIDDIQPLVEIYNRQQEQKEENEA